MRDFNGNEVARVYSDQWGIYNGLYFSTWAVNPPNPTGYVPQMAIACMNDPGPIPDPAHPGQMITDPAYNPAYSNFCYETPFMPGFTAYMDTPVIPTHGVRRRLQPAGRRVPGQHAGDLDGRQQQLDGAARAVGDDGRRAETAAQPAHGSIHTVERAAGRQHPFGRRRHHDSHVRHDQLQPARRCASDRARPVQAARNSAIAGAVALNINSRTRTTGYSASADLGDRDGHGDRAGRRLRTGRR